MITPYHVLRKRLDGPENERTTEPAKAPCADAHPRLVTRGERSGLAEEPFRPGRWRPGKHGKFKWIEFDVPAPLESVPAFTAVTDYLSCTFLLQNDPGAIRGFIDEFAHVAGVRFGSLEPRRGGLDGFERSFTIGDTKGLFAIGGQRGRAYLKLSGYTCGLIDQTRWFALRKLLEHRYAARITRWDGAVDEYRGLHGVDWAVAQYHKGGFTTGGRPPKIKLHGDWIGDGEDGRTVYVGTRKSGKLLRVYEKGKEQGDPTSPWCRTEVEYRNVDRLIPWEVLETPGPFVAGAYPCLDWIAGNGPAFRILTAKKLDEINYARLVHFASVAYGRLLGVMLEREGSAEAVLEKLTRQGLPSRLDIASPEHNR